MRSFAAISCVLAGCAYQADTLRPTTQVTSQRTTLGCLDLAIERRPDLPNGDAVVAYAFGNRCDHPALVDLAAAAVIGRTDEQRQLELAPYDPRYEVRPLHLDGRAMGREAIAYPSDERLNEVCVDAASIAHASATHWLCFTSRPQLREVP
ncbi:MAG: hypothetical protein JWO36_4973 [Myxococcales bacterium]|nr:hypothetical protein [Myxococcales bacterium]